MSCHAIPCYAMAENGGHGEGVGGVRMVCDIFLLYYGMPCHAMPYHAMQWRRMAGMGRGWEGYEWSVTFFCYIMACHVMPCHTMLCNGGECRAWGGVGGVRMVCDIFFGVSLT